MLTDYHNGIYAFDAGYVRPLLFPSSSPTQFDPDAMRASILRILGFNPEAVYLTHFSRLAPLAGLAPPTELVAQAPSHDASREAFRAKRADQPPPREGTAGAGLQFAFPAGRQEAPSKPSLMSSGMAALGQDLLERLDQYVAIARAASESEDTVGQIRDGLCELLLDAAHRHGCHLGDAEILEIWHTDLELNAQGLAYWLETGSDR